jgi:hypothetical protein
MSSTSAHGLVLLTILKTAEFIITSARIISQWGVRVLLASNAMLQRFVIEGPGSILALRSWSRLAMV